MVELSHFDFSYFSNKAKHEINQLSHPRALLSVNVGGKIVTDRVMRSVWSFFFFILSSRCFYTGVKWYGI